MTMLVDECFSVVIPTFNRADLLPFTLDAVLAQTVSLREIIVVDDGSRDCTADVLARYASRGVRHLRIENSGDLVARNMGLRAAASDLVAFCDSDDLWKPEYLASMAALWRAEPAVKLAYCDFAVVHDGRWEAKTKFADAPSDFWDNLRHVGPDLAVFDEPVVKRLIAYQPFFPSCMVVDRRFFLEIGGWDEAVSRIVGCDFATALRCAEHSPLGVVRRPLVGIRKHGGNISGDVQAMNLGDSKVLEHVLATRPSVASYAAEIKASIGRRRRDALDTAFAREDFASVRAIFALLPEGQRSPGTTVKALIASLPRPLRHAASAALLRLGSLKSSAVRASGRR
jgi:glycosyltransferase involved in cell wall biosynthesis